MKLYEIIGNFSVFYLCFFCWCVYVQLCGIRKFNFKRRFYFLHFICVCTASVQGSPITRDKKRRSKVWALVFFLISKMNQMRCWENKCNRFGYSMRVFFLLLFLLKELLLFFFFHWRSRRWSKTKLRIKKQLKKKRKKKANEM